MTLEQLENGQKIATEIRDLETMIEQIGNVSFVVFYNEATDTILDSRDMKGFETYFDTMKFKLLELIDIKIVLRNKELTEL